MRKKECLSVITPMMLLSIGVILFILGCDSPVNQPKPAQLKDASFVDQKQCIGCHKQEHEEWQSSHHDLAMDVASNDTVLGDFDSSKFSAHGVTSTFFKREGKFFVQTDGKNGELNDFEIDFVFGVDPLQQYLIKFPDGRMQALDIAWDSRAKEKGGQRWFHLHPNEKIDSKHPFHWTKRFLNWNFMCAECHSTNLKKNFDLTTNTFKTTWKKIDVGCQACHGPGSNHITWAQAKDKNAWKEGKGLFVNLGAKDARVQIETCARCHSRRSNISDKYEHGKPFMDFYKPQILREPLYHPDGQIKDEVYVYGSFIQSKKHARGVRCTDCHNAHTSRLRLSGNSLCISCHNTSPEKRFEGLKQKNFDTEEHHFHKAASKGAQCVSCHMPDTTYMGVDPRRDHGFRIPRPDLSVKLGTPNACIQCHKSQSNEWAKKAVDKWYPASVELREKSEHFSEVFAAVQSTGVKSQSSSIKLIFIMNDEQQPAIIRATAASLLDTFPSLKVIDGLNGVLDNGDPLIRYHAIHSIDALIPKAAGEPMLSRKLIMLAPLLNDPIRAVRTEAARALSNVPENLFSSQQYLLFERSIAEYSERQASIADRPEAHSSMGLVHQRMGSLSEAEASFKTAIRLVPDDLPSHFSLGNLYNSQGRNIEAEATFRKIISIDAGNGEAYYSLGLLLAEVGKGNDSESALSKAAQLLPDRPRVRYNHALSLKHLGRDVEALKAMQQVVTLNTIDPMMVYVLTTWLVEDKRYNEALPWAEKLVVMLPNDDDGAKRLLVYIRNNKLMKERK